jgi:hypothetical protein
MKPSTMTRPVADAAAGHGVVPGLLHVGRAVDLALALAAELLITGLTMQG